MDLKRHLPFLMPGP